MIRTSLPRAGRLAAIVFLATLLGGCFASKRELISATDAEFPYEEITFTEVGRNDPTTLVKRDGAYRALQEDNSAAFRFRKVAADTFVVQASGDDNGKKVILYAILKIDNRANVVRAYKSVADEDDKGPGLYACEDDYVCFDTLQPYVDYALKAIAAGAEPDATYRILAVKTPTP